MGYYTGDLYIIPHPGGPFHAVTGSSRLMMSNIVTMSNMEKCQPNHAASCYDYYAISDDLHLAHSY